MALYAKITRDLEDTGERKEFAAPPALKDDLASEKPYWVPVVYEDNDTSTGKQTVIGSYSKEVKATGIKYTRPIRDKTQAEIDAEQSAEIDASIDAIQANRSALKALAEGLFIAFNEAREAGGKQPITKQAYLTWLRTQIQA